MTDLIVLVADNNMEQAVRGLLRRHLAIGIREVTHQVLVHPRRDPGCLNEAHDFLRPFARTYAHALVMFDYAGCGHEQAPPSTLADEVKRRLEQNGWLDRAEVVILSPELEVWVWSGSPHVEDCLGWAGRQPSLRVWLADRGHWPSNQAKPAHPKEAMETALREVRKPRSSAIYMDLANHVSLQGHTEPAFLRFTGALRRWFEPQA